MLAVTRSADAMTAPGNDEHDEHCCSGIYPSRPDTSVTRACVLCLGQLNNVMHLQVWVVTTASKSSIRRFIIMEKAPTMAISWLKVATTAFTFKTLLRHYAKRALTPRSLNVELGPQRNYHKGQAGWLAK